MNAPSPFTPAGEAHFTVKELASLLPGNMVRVDALPPDHPVELPLNVLRESMAHGRPQIRLSAIYTACPFLFTRQVLPQEDIDIALPAGKVNRLLEAASHEAPAPAIESPFARAASAFAGQAPPQNTVPEPVLPPMRSNSPFGIANGNGSGAAPSPFSLKSPGVTPNGALPNPGDGTPSPFAAVVGKPLDNPFASASLPPANGSQVFEGNTPPAPSPFARASGPDSNPFAAVKPPTTPVAPSPFAAIAAAAAAPKVATSPFSLAGMLPPKNPATPPSPPVIPPAPVPAPAPTPVPVQEMRSERQTPMPPLPPQPMQSAPQIPAPAPIIIPTPAPAPQPEAVAAPAPVPPPASTAASVQETLNFPLRPLLGNYKQEELGFDPLAVPESVEVTVPASLITAQLSTGRVELDLDQVRNGLAERFHPAFARTQPDLRFQIPLAEVFRILPQHLIPAPELPAPDHSPILTSPFQTPFTLKAEEDQIGIPLPPELSPGKQITAPTPLNRSTTPPFGLPPAAPAIATGMDAAAVIPPPAPFPAAPAPQPEAPVAAARPNPFSRPPGTGTAPTSGINIPPAPATQPPALNDSDDLGQAIHAESLRSTPPAYSQPPQEPAAPPAQPAAVPVAPAPAARAFSAPAPKPADDINFGIVDDIQQLALRALFMTEESLDAGQILTRCAALPGIQAAILMNGSTTRSALDGAGNEEAHTFASTAPQTYSSITTLAESMGMPQHGNFTIRSNKSVRSFFVEKGICLAVLHEQAVFQPGVRERLILIARALSSMES